MLPVKPESTLAVAVIAPSTIAKLTRASSPETAAGIPFVPASQIATLPSTCAQTSTADFAAAVALITSVNFALSV